MTTETSTHQLITFHPAPPNTYSGSWEYGLADVGTDAVLVANHLDLHHLDELAGSPLTHTLYRALKNNEMLVRHFNADSSLQGEPWYDALPMIEVVDVLLVADDKEIGYDAVVDLFALGMEAELRPERIVMRLGVSKLGMSLTEIEIETDVALFPSDDAPHDASNIPAIVAPGISIDPHDLAELFCGAFFTVDDGLSLPPELQRDTYMESAFNRAARIVHDAADATQAIIERHAESRLRQIVPPGMEVSIRLNREAVIEVDVRPVSATD